MKCFFHKADLDGHCSGAIVKYTFPECEMIGVDYGGKFPWETIQSSETVYMVDFSLEPFPDMIRLSGMCSLIWIDHHKTAIEEAQLHPEFLDRISFLLRDDSGACESTWRFLQPGQEIPLSVHLLGRYDVWDHSDERTLPFQYGMRLRRKTWPDNQEFWQALFTSLDETSVGFIASEGRVVLDYVRIDNEKYAQACAFETMLGGMKCVALNRLLTNAQLFKSVWDSEKFDMMIAFGWKNNQWRVGLYSDKPSIDVSVVAKVFGGGGHKGASGFDCKELPFVLPRY